MLVLIIRATSMPYPWRPGRFYSFTDAACIFLFYFYYKKVSVFKNNKVPIKELIIKLYKKLLQALYSIIKLKTYRCIISNWNMYVGVLSVRLARRRNVFGQDTLTSRELTTLIGTTDNNRLVKVSETDRCTLKACTYFKGWWFYCGFYCEIVIRHVV